MRLELKSLKENGIIRFFTNLDFRSYFNLLSYGKDARAR